ncbi:hypothetical protein F750_6551 [Streptomyces sp. PAMC 26508]|nr:hypothetical protein F750_6551 [Streptomyces sp. PAMC 26508]
MPRHPEVMPADAENFSGDTRLDRTEAVIMTFRARSGTPGGAPG